MVEPSPERLCDICGQKIEGTGVEFSDIEGRPEYHTCDSGKCMASVVKCPEGTDPKDFYKTLFLTTIKGCPECGSDREPIAEDEQIVGEPGAGVIWVCPVCGHEEI